MKNTGMLDWIQLPKWSVFYFSILSTLVFVACFFPVLSGMCSEYDTTCIDSRINFVWIIFWAPVLVLLSLITYPLEKKYLIHGLNSRCPGYCSLLW